MLLILVAADLALILVPIYTSFWVFCLKVGVCCLFNRHRSIFIT